LIGLLPAGHTFGTQPNAQILRSQHFMRNIVVLAASFAVAMPAAAQAGLKVAASGRASTEVSLQVPRPEGTAGPAPLKIRIDYGVPQVRGRVVHGALPTDMDKVWRLGANEATTLTTPVDLVIGGAAVPKGTYSLFAKTAQVGTWQLIVNKKTGEWGTDYDASADLVKIDLKSMHLKDPIESLSIWLIPSPDGSPKGELRFAWGDMAFSTTWSMKP
jgi:hypothetical protein